MSKTAPLPPPYLGQSDRLPVAAMQNPYAEKFENFFSDGGTCQIRYGDRVTVTREGSAAVYPTIGLASVRNKMFMVRDRGSPSRLTFYDVSYPDGSFGAGTVVYTYSHAGDDEIHTVFFRERLMWFGEFQLRPVNGIVEYNSAANTWGLNTYTWGTITSPFGGAVHKNRAYFLNRNSTSYGYSEIDSISGPITEVNLRSVVSEDCFLYAIRSISLSEGIQQENVLAFIFSTGEVLVYSGSYPDSPSWQLVGRFMIPKPLYYNSVVDAKGDSYVMTEYCPVSLRDLFIKGADLALSEGIGLEIAYDWKNNVNALREAGTAFPFYNGVYDKINDRLVISFPYYVQGESEDYTIQGWSNFFVYSYRTKSWSRIFCKNDNVGVTKTAYYANNVYYATGDGTVMLSNYWNDSDRQDQNFSQQQLAISARIKSAPLPTSKFGTNQIAGIEIILGTDIYNAVTVELIGDLGATTTGTQKTTGNGTNISKCFFNVGTNATYVQYDLKVESINSQQGTTVYATNIWFDSGERGSR